jgi:hypothetical protein
MKPRDQALKRATRALVDAAGGCEAAAGLCRLGKSQLAAAGSINEPDRWLPVDVLRDLMAVTRGLPGCADLLAHLAAEAGFALVPLGDGPVIDPRAAIAQLATEAADVVSELARFEPGRSDPRLLIKESDDLLRVAAGVRAAAVELERGGA